MNNKNIHVVSDNDTEIIDELCSNMSKLVKIKKESYAHSTIWSDIFYNHKKKWIKLNSLTLTTISNKQNIIKTDEIELLFSLNLSNEYKKYFKSSYTFSIMKKLLVSDHNINYYHTSNNFLKTIFNSINPIHKNYFKTVDEYKLSVLKKLSSLNCSERVSALFEYISTETGDELLEAKISSNGKQICDIKVSDKLKAIYMLLITNGVGCIPSLHDKQEDNNEQLNTRLDVCLDFYISDIFDELINALIIKLTPTGQSYFHRSLITFLEELSINQNYSYLHYLDVSVDDKLNKDLSSRAFQSFDGNFKEIYTFQPKNIIDHSKIINNKNNKVKLELTNDLLKANLSDIQMERANWLACRENVFFTSKALVWDTYEFENSFYMQYNYFNKKISFAKQAKGLEVPRGGIILNNAASDIVAGMLTMVCNKISCQNDIQNNQTLLVVDSCENNLWIKCINNKFVNLSTYVYDISNRQYDKNYQVVITTYKTIKEDDNSESILCKTHWYRLILDNAEFINKIDSKTFQFFLDLCCDVKWCIFNTNLKDFSSELYPILKLIGYEPWNNMYWWTKLERKYTETKNNVILNFINILCSSPIV